MDMNSLLQLQNDLYGRINRAYDNLKKVGSANITLGMVEARLAALDDNWKRFQTQHDTLISKYRKDLADQDYTKSQVYAHAEETYLAHKGMFLDSLRQMRSKPQENISTAKQELSHAPRTTLPRIQLPQFSGKYEEWPSFRDLFHSIIGKDVSTTHVEKLHYLKSCLKGEAELLIRNLPTTDENFDRAWKSLVDYYENKRLLVRSYLSQFNALQKIKSESANDLRRLYHGIVNTVGALDSIGRPITKGEDLFVFLVVELLDPRSRREWENSLSETTEPPSYAALQQFLERRLHTLESLPSAKVETPAKPSATLARQTRSMHARQQDDTRNRCTMCGKNHFIMLCDTYQSKTAEDRKQHVLANGLCFNCLGRHKLNECASKKTCSACNARHHTSLHDALRASEGAKTSNASMHDALRASEDAKTSHFSRQPSKLPVAVLLATARVRVTDRYGDSHIARALVDQGSESSLISESLAQRLKLKRSPTSTSVYGVGGTLTGVARGLVNFKISPLKGGSSIAVSALILPKLTLYDGGIHVDQRTWKHLDGLELADPDVSSSDPVELLLGADVFAAILRQGLRRGGSHEPVAQQTSLGWILSGSVSRTVAAPRAHSCHSYHNHVSGDLCTLVQQFWQQEEVISSANPLTAEEKECEDFFVRTHSRTADGRYVVRLPVKLPLPDLTGTRHSSMRLLFHMEGRFSRDNRLHHLYVDFMKQYEDLGHMTPVRRENSTADSTCYLPHHGVLREMSSSTKLRVVFNGSSAVASGDSLNRHLLVGPNLLPALADVLLRWRIHRYVLAADIEKMYRQILVDPADRHLQRIVWRYSSEEEVQEYQLNTVTYGLACAPFLAIRTLQQLADDEEAQFPQGAAALRQDIYVDDILTGASSIADAKELQQQLSELSMAGGFPLRKWSANEADLLTHLPLEHRTQRDLRSWQAQESHATLGVQWHPSIDSFSFTTRAIAVQAITKRSVLSLTARLFDPLGWLAPAIIRAKILFQSTWLQGIDWDTSLDAHSVKLWKDFQADLPKLEEIRIPRRLHLNARSELHGFCDASERAYAAVIYLLSDNDEGDRQVTIITAKTKVAPLKQVSLPRLELCAATLLARLAAHVQRTLGVLKAPMHLWSDSTVALAWIRGHPTRWQTYVANRVSEIQSTLPEAQWHHLPGKDNPADCASRGISPSELIAHPLWWHGPPWLSMEPSFWPVSNESPPDGTVPEKRSRAHAAVIQKQPLTEPDELIRFSTLYRLLRVTAWCRRWLRLRHSEQSTTTADINFRFKDILATSECDDARWAWIRVVQGESYKDELKAIAQGTPSKGPLAKLTPFTDSQGILRVGGRIRHSLLSFDEKHPAILPSSSHFTKLVVEACHQRTLHGGVQLTLGAIRQQFWIPRGRALVKAVIHRCVTCVRWRAAAPQQLMSDLPRPRVTPSRPFLHTGVDYAGPIMLRTTKGRGHRAHKAFIAVFVCLSTKAVHLEVASDYTADAFLAALRRFTARRGLCHCLYSDCGTNFVGADKQLRAFFAASSKEQKSIANQLVNEQIQWRFNPPSAPHFGGLWEAAVKSLKHHLRRVLGETTLTFEEMSTLLAQVEACLNSRPLQALSDDPEDTTVLTPGHFLIGSSLCAIPEPSLLEPPDNRLTRWQLLQKMRDHFWDRWSHEYLQSLFQRSKWLTATDQAQVGRLCLILNENTPPARWPLARIIRAHPGRDGKIRVVTVRTATSEFVRPIAKLILLPTCKEDINLEKQTSSPQGSQ